MCFVDRLPSLTAFQNAKYLYVSYCLAYCPFGSTPVGAGNYGRYCELGTTTGATLPPISPSTKQRRDVDAWMVPTAAPCVLPELDVVLVLGATSEALWPQLKQFAVQALEQLSGHTRVRTTLVSFAAGALVRHKLSQSQDTAAVHAIVRDAPFTPQPGHALAKALNLVRTGVLVEGSGYRGGKAVVLVVTDASDPSSKGLMTASASLRALATVVAVGVGSSVSRRDLLLVAATEREALHIEEGEDLVHPATAAMLLPVLCANLAAAPVACVDGRTNTTHEACTCRRRGCSSCELMEGAELGCLACQAPALLHLAACVDVCPPGFAADSDRGCVPAEVSISRRGAVLAASLQSTLLGNATGLPICSSMLRSLRRSAGRRRLRRACRRRRVGRAPPPPAPAVTPSSFLACTAAPLET